MSLHAGFPVSQRLFVGSGLLMLLVAVSHAASSEDETLTPPAVVTPSVEEVIAPANAAADSLPFVRVHVPAGRVADVSGDGVRYIPMALDEFEEAVSQSSLRIGKQAGRMPRPAAEQLRYEARLDEAGWLRGKISFEIPAALAGSSLPLGEMPLRNCRWQAATQNPEQGQPNNVGESLEVDLGGLPDGSVELSVPGPGWVTALVDARPLRATQPLVQTVPLSQGQAEYSFHLPLAPALSTTLVLDLPAELEPRIAGSEPAELKQLAEEQREGRRLWRFTLGPRAALALEVSAHPRNRLTAWSAVRIGRRATQIETVLLPETVWNARTIPLRSSSEHTLISGHVQSPEAVESLPVELVAEGSGKLTIRLPVAAVGTNWPLRVGAVIAGTGLLDRTVDLLGIRPPDGWWAGGGMRVHVEPEMQIASVVSTGWLAVSPSATAHWPGRASGLLAASEADDATAGFAFEQQEAGGEVTVAVAARQPEFDIARVTTVDVTTAALLGRASCDIRVRRGSVHRLEARIGAEWLIDAVEPLVSDDLLPPSDDAEVGERIGAERVLDEAAERIGTRYEWRVVRGSGGDRLILDLPVAVTPARELRLRISGHRRGVPAGGRFKAVAADMVQLEGEASGQVWIDLRTSPETTLMAEGAVESPPPFDPRLTLLAEGGTWRQRVPGGRLAPPCEFVFLRRRPPLNVEARTRLTVRAEQLSETFSFTCQPQQGELDALTVHFSEAVGDLEWSLLGVGETTVFARRQEAVSRPPGNASVPATRQAAESWLIELTPPVIGTTTIRATGSRPFRAELPVPLAWVEAAEETIGYLTIQAVGQDRPKIHNKRLRELPANLPGDGPLETLAEFTYDKSVALAGVGPAIEMEPLPPAERPVPRCWIWNENTTVRCSASATAEYETGYSLENDGRASVLLTVPAGHRLLGVMVNEERLPLPAGKVSELPIYLPSGQRRIRLVVRSVSTVRSLIGFWRLTTEVPTLDAPTLTREWQMLLPDAVRMVAAPQGFRERNRPPFDWSTRLLGAAQREVSPPTAVSRGVDRALTSRQFIPVSGRYRQTSFLLIKTTLLAGLAVLVAVLTAAFTAFIPWTRSWMVLTIVIISAVATLWVPEPVDMLARAVLWGGLGVTALRLGSIRRASQLRLGITVLCAIAAGPVLAAEQPMRVFMTPVEGETTALVPESLFRVLATTETAAVRPRIRIIDCRVEVMPPELRGNRAGDELWWINLLVESDAATVLPLDQAATETRFADRPIRVDGGVVRAAMSVDRRRLTVSLPAAGRHLVAVPVEPARTRWGDLEVTEIRLPISPETTLMYGPSGAGGARLQDARNLWCEQADHNGHFRPASEPRIEASGGFSYLLPAAERVRLVRPVDPQTTLVSVIREASSWNQITWREDDCQLTARFSLDPGKAILPTLWLQADPRLMPLASDHADKPVGLLDDYELRQISPGVFRVDRRNPVSGPVQIEIPFTMPLNAAVGDVALPDVWLRGVQVDHRETILEADDNYRLAVSFPGTIAPPQIEEQNGGDTTLRWSTDVVETLVEPSLVDVRGTDSDRETGDGRPWRLHRQPVRLSVTRQQSAIRGRQQLVVTTGQRATTLVFEAAVDARETVWMNDSVAVPRGFEIKSCQVFRCDRFGDVEGTVDLHQQAAEDGSRMLVLQQPAAGNYLLRVEARRNKPIPDAGRLPLIQSKTAALLPLTILWDDTRDRGQPELLAAPQPAARGDGSSDALTVARYPLRREPLASDGWRLELPAGVVPQRYRFRPVEQTVPLAEKPTARPTVAPARQTQNLTELADLEVVIDERGRISGVGRYDLTTTAAELQLQLPAGFRLFEVLLDGRQVQPMVPGSNGPDNVWTIPMRPSPWPHELLVVFVGELGEEVLWGKPVAFGLPELPDLPVARRLVSVDSSSEQRLLVGGTGQSLSAAEAKAIRVEAEEALAQAITHVVPDVASETLTRLSRFRESRALMLEKSPLEAWAGWSDAVETLPEQSRLRLGPRGDARWRRIILAGTEANQMLTVRFVTSSPAGLASIAATVVLLLIGATGWWLLTRRPTRCLVAVARWWPLVAAVAGFGWLGTRVPAWPGGGLLLVGGWELGRRWLLAQLQNQPSRAVHELETVRERSLVSVHGSSVTRTAARNPSSSTITHHPASQG